MFHCKKNFARVIFLLHKLFNSLFKIWCQKSVLIAVIEIFKWKINTGPLNQATLQTGIVQLEVQNDLFFFFGRHGMVFFGFQFLGSILFYNNTLPHNNLEQLKLEIQNEEVLYIILNEWYGSMNNMSKK